MSIELERINNTLGKMAYYLGNHESIVVGTSGGSDSDTIVHMIATYFREYLPKIHFVFVNEGLEYKATIEHLKYLEQRYNITIEKIRGESVVTAVRRFGVPVISKWHSHMIEYWIRANTPSCTKSIMGEYERRESNFTPAQKRMALAIKERGIKVSAECCRVSKKMPMMRYFNKHKCDMTITGERRAEGGIRAVSHKDCFEPNNNGHIDKFMPLFFWNDETKAYYKKQEGIIYSDCYEVWGMKRIGCVGCPFNSNVRFDLECMKVYEPLRYKACLNVFGESYRLMDEFGIRKERILDDENQISVFDLLEVNK